MKKQLRIAMFGHKRIPSREGGIEIVVEELCIRMVRDSNQVTCYNRAGHHVSGSEYDTGKRSVYKGIRLKSVPTIEKKRSGSSKCFFLCFFMLCIWKVRCCTYSRRRTGFFYVVAENV